MNRIALFAALLSIAACSKKSDAPAPPAASVTEKGADKGSAAGPGSGSGSAAPIVIPPYTPAADVSQPIKDAIAAKDRTDKDRSIDAGRKPGEVLQFFKVAPGQHVVELFAAGGYTTELLARVVGDKGTVVAQNNDYIDKMAHAAIAARAAKLPNITPTVATFEAPFPTGTKDLDLVVDVLNYHDTVWMKVDRAAMNKAIFDALKSGGIYGIVDHSGPPGSGIANVQTTHRIEEDTVKQEILAAGFKLDGESDVLRNPDDKRDWNASPKDAGVKRGTSDRFVLRFVKP